MPTQAARSVIVVLQGLAAERQQLYGDRAADVDVVHRTDVFGP